MTVAEIHRLIYKQRLMIFTLLEEIKMISAGIVSCVVYR
jgi:hypothetical protein